MSSIRPFILATAMAAIFGSAWAQPQAASGPGPGASAANGARGGPGHMGGRWGTQYTPGWSMMTPQERREHQTRMQSMKNHDECRTYMDEHHRQMAARAKEKGVQVPAVPRRDACAALKR